MRLYQLFPIALVLITLSCLDQPKKLTDLNAELAFRTESLLGEGAFWNYRNNSLYWVDIEGRKLHIFDPEKKSDRFLATESRVGTVVPQTDSTAVIALENGIYIINTNTGETSLLSDIESDISKNRFNDGKCDPNGNLWVGSMNFPQNEASGNLYKVKPDGQAERMKAGITISNGIVWSSDNRTMYYIDTPTAVIKAFDFDPETSTITNERVAVEVSEADGYPDGMTIDENDHLWVGLWNGNAVAQYDPESGTLIRKVWVPAHNVTSCAFGGPDLDVLYITTSSLDMTDEEADKFPDAGSLFRVVPGVKGVKSPFFGKN